MGREFNLPIAKKIRKRAHSMGFVDLINQLGTEHGPDWKISDPTVLTVNPLHGGGQALIGLNDVTNTTRLIVGRQGPQRAGMRDNRNSCVVT